jgi:hypothetical protein
VFPAVWQGAEPGATEAAQITRCHEPGRTEQPGPEREEQMLTKRYRLKLATWTVVREAGQPWPRRLILKPSPPSARNLINEHDDDKEHFWMRLLNAQSHLTLTHQVSMGSPAGGSGDRVVDRR